MVTQWGGEGELVSIYGLLEASVFPVRAWVSLHQ